MNEGGLNLLWVTEFPLFEGLDSEGRPIPAHHPFTMPHPDDLDRTSGRFLQHERLRRAVLGTLVAIDDRAAVRCGECFQDPSRRCAPVRSLALSPACGVLRKVSQGSC